MIFLVKLLTKLYIYFLKTEIGREGFTSFCRNSLQIGAYDLVECAEDYCITKIYGLFSICTPF
jgi:hypothetical protein